MGIRSSAELSNKHQTLAQGKVKMTDPGAVNLTETQFWELIESTGQRAAGDLEAHEDLLRGELEKHSAPELVAYQQILNGKIQALAELDEELLEALPDLGADDEFNDVCHWTVSLGKQAYERILKSPKLVKKYVKAAKLEWFPTLFGQAYVIYRDKTGQEMPASAPPAIPVAEQTPPPSRESVVARSVTPSASVSTNQLGDAKELKVQWKTEFVSTGRGGKIPCIHACPEVGLVAAGRPPHGQVYVWNSQGELCWQALVKSSTEDNSNTDVFPQVVIANRTKQLITRFNEFRHLVNIWDLENGRRLAELPTAGLGSQISSNGEYALLCDPPGPIELWATSTQTKIHTLKSRQDNYLVAASADLSRVVHGDFKTFTVMDALAGKELISFRANSKVVGITISPDGRWLFGEDRRGKLVMGWDVTTGKKIAELVNFEQGLFSPDCKYCVRFESGTGKFEIWDVATVQKIQEVKWPLFQWRYRNHEVLAGNSLVALTADGHVRQWDLPTGQLKAHAKLVTNTEFNCIHSADGETIFVSDFESLYCLS